jgi:hypothetical protein
MNTQNTNADEGLEKLETAPTKFIRAGGTNFWAFRSFLWKQFRRAIYLSTALFGKHGCLGSGCGERSSQRSYRRRF